MLQIPKVQHMLFLHKNLQKWLTIVESFQHAWNPAYLIVTPKIDKPTRKRADMMTLTGCGVIPNAKRNFLANTRLIMNVTIGHVFDTHHNFKPNALRNLATAKCLKYAEHYQRQRLAFAPIVANALGQFGADTLQFLWLPIIKPRIRLDHDLLLIYQ
jgi:hypothetical protein